MAEKEAPKKRKLGWKVWTPFAVAGLLAVYAAVGFIVVPMVAKSMLPEKLSAALHRKVRIAEVAVNPFALTVTLRGLAIDEADGRPFGSVDEIFADAELAPALGGTWTLSALRIVAPRADISRERDGTFNFSDMKPPESGAQKAEAAPDDAPPRFRVRSLRIDGGRLVFDDRTPARPFRTELASVNLAAENLTNLPAESTEYRIGLRTEAGENLKIQGKAQLSEMRAQAALSLENLHLAKYAAYLQGAAGFDLAAGTLSLDVAADFGAVTGKPDDLKLTAETRLNGLVLKDRKTGRPVVELDRLVVEKAAVDLAATAVDVKSVAVSGLRAYAMVDENGDSSLARLAPPAEKPGPSPAPPVPKGASEKMPPWKVDLGAIVLSDASLVAGGLAPAGETADKPSVVPVAAFSRLAVTGIGVETASRSVTVRKVAWDGGSVHLERDAAGRINLARLAGNPGDPAAGPDGGARPAPSEEAAPWVVAVEALHLENWVVAAVDRVPADPVHVDLSRIGLAVQGFSTRPENRFDLTLGMGINEGGSLSMKGKAGLSPLAANLAVETDGIDIHPVQNYLQDTVRVLITRGRFENRGHLSLGAAPGGETAVTYKGRAALVDFATVDKAHTRDLVKWNALHLDDMDIGTAPLKIDIGKVALTDFFARAIVNEDGSLNLTRVLAQEDTPTTEKPPAAEKTPEDKTEKPESAAAGPQIRIGTVTLQGGRVRFSDRQIQPNFETEFMDLGGSVSGLSSENLARADVLLKGRLDNHAPMEITGQINPLIEDRYTDIKIHFSDIEMSPFTPYSAKYLGYVLDKGKLSLDLSYRVSQRHLDAENRIRFDQLTLGDRVESPEATRLPIGLALSLLEDRNGVIDLDLPLTGNLDDPEFSIGGIVLKMLVNLVKKIITAPFAALGSIFGGGAEMSQIDFLPGVVDLNDAQRQKLDKLADALYQRPGLKLDIQGEVAPEQDRVALRKRRFDDLLVASKIQDRVKKGLPVEPREEMAVTAEEKVTCLTAAYAAADFPKPRGADGKIKVLPPEEMEKLLYTHIAVTDDGLRQMAAERAARVKDYILGIGKVAPERVFLKEPAPVAVKKGGEEDKRESRVVFSLK